METASRTAQVSVAVLLDNFVAATAEEEEEEKQELLAQNLLRVSLHPLEPSVPF